MDARGWGRVASAVAVFAGVIGGVATNRVQGPWQVQAAAFGTAVLALGLATWLIGFAERSRDRGDASGGGERAARPLVLGAVPQAPRAFQPRQGLLDQLVGPRARTGVSVIIGSRGVGKTQIAGAVARTRLAEEWRLVAWIDAQDVDAVRVALNEVAAALGIEPPGGVPDGAPGDSAGGGALALRHFLETDGGRCLLVFDNVLDAAALRPYLPAGGSAQIVVTSTNRAVENLGGRVPVEVFTRPEAITLLIEWTGRDDPAGAGRVADALGCLPLALAQAAAVISRHALSYETYLTRLSAVRIAAYFPPVHGGDYPHGLAEAIMISVHEPATGSGQARLTMLGLVAMLASSGVRRELLYRAGEMGLLDGAALSAVQVDEVLGGLTEASLITISETAGGGAGAVIMHGMVMRVVRESAAHDGRLRDLAAAAIELVTDRLLPMDLAWTDRLGAEDLALQIMALTEHLPTGDRTDPAGSDLFDAVLNLRGWAQWYLADLRTAHADAITFGERLVEHAQRRLGADHPHTLTFRANLAGAYRMSGDLGEAVPRLQRSLADSERVLGPTHRNTLVSRNNLAESYRVAGDLPRAISLLERNFAECERLLGVDHPDTLINGNNLASAYEEAGDLDRAVPLLLRTLAHRERVLGAEHPETLQSRNNLACAYRAAGDPGRAIPMFEECLADRERTLGSVHPDTLTSRNNLAGAYRAAGDFTKAVPLLERTLADCERTLGSAHHVTQVVRANLGQARIEARPLISRLRRQISRH